VHPRRFPLVAKTQSVGCYYREEGFAAGNWQLAKTRYNDSE